MYRIEENRIEENPLNQKLTCRGQWYYYYGNGEYGYTPVTVSYTHLDVYKRQM